MHNLSNSRIDLAIWCLFSGALLLLLYLKLLPALLGGLLVYALVNALVPTLRTPAPDRARMLAVMLIATIVVALLIAAGLSLTTFLRGSGESIPALIQRMAEIIEGSRGRLPSWLLLYLPENADELRTALVNWLRGHTDTFQVAGAGLGRALAHILIGMVIGALLALESAVTIHEHGPVSKSFAERALRLEHAFRRVVFAQFWISAINTVLTALYLTVLLPAAGVNLPFTKTLIMITFVAGLLPILGNLISNTVIFIVSLSQSLLVALVSLAYLIIIHKLEYFLNARIIGGHIRARAWELLIAMLVMEALFGIAGLIAAPIYYAYIKDELRARELV
ncbi:MAG: AI-2E family transporter [Gammaproteobacteria bacterium]